MTKFISLENFDDTNVELVDRDIEYSSLADSPLSDSADSALRSAIDDTTALEKTNTVLEENQDTIEDLPESSRVAIEVAVESIRERLLGTKARHVVGVESFTSRSRLQLAIEENKNIIERAWDAIVKFFKGIYNWIVGLFSKKKNVVKEVEDKANLTLTKVVQVIKAEPTTPPAGIEVVESNSSVTEFTTDKFVRVTGDKDLTFKLSDIGSLAFMQYFEKFNGAIEESNYGHGMLSQVSTTLSTMKAKDVMDAMNRVPAAENPLEFEFMDRELNRGVKVSTTGVLEFIYPEPKAVLYKMNTTRDFDENDAKTIIDKLIKYGKSTASKSLANVSRIKTELEKINKVLAASKNPEINKEKVANSIKDSQTLVKLHVNIFTDFNKDYDLLLKFFQQCVSLNVVNPE